MGRSINSPTSKFCTDAWSCGGPDYWHAWIRRSAGHAYNPNVGGCRRKAAIELDGFSLNSVYKLALRGCMICMAGIDCILLYSIAWCAEDVNMLRVVFPCHQELIVFLEFFGFVAAFSFAIVQLMFLLVPLAIRVRVIPP